MSTKKGCIKSINFNSINLHFNFFQGAYVVKDFNIDADLLPRVIKSSRFSLLLETFIEEDSKMISIAYLKFYGFINNLNSRKG